VPDVCDVLDVVLAGTVVDAVDRAVVVVADVVEVVDDELESDGLLEQAASTRAQTGRINNRMHRDCRVFRIAPAYDCAATKWGFFQDRCAESVRRSAPSGAHRRRP
jgi:hypothetical protein